MASILVTGAGGYIGSVTAQALQTAGESIVVLDDLARGHRKALPSNVPFFQGSIGDTELVRRICAQHEVTAVVHFAALAYVGESVTDPRRYFENNVLQGVTFLGALLDSGVREIVSRARARPTASPSLFPSMRATPNVPRIPTGSRS